MRILPQKLSAALDVFRYFRSPLLIAMLRLGVLRLPYFVYNLRLEAELVTMLARPSCRSMGDLFVLREVFVHQTYRDILPLLPPGPVSVVDVGANLGSFFIWLSRQHGVSSGFCFEPQPESARLCRANLFMNGFDVPVLVAAAGATSRFDSLRGCAGRPGGASLYRDHRGGSRFNVEVVNFLKWLRDGREFDVLKLDCEGAEWEIVASPDADALRRCGLIVAEVHEDPFGVHAVEAFPRFLERHRFQIIRWDGHAHGLCIACQHGNT